MNRFDMTEDTDGITQYMEIFADGEYVKYSDAEALIKELYETIDNNSKKLIKQKAEINLKNESIKQLLSIQEDWEKEINKLTKQNKKMLESLKKVIVQWNNTEDQACLDRNPMDALLMMAIIDAENVIEKIEGEQNE